MPTSAGTAPRRSGLAQSRSRDTRRKLIHAALDTWTERGFEEAFEATTVAEIARAAGVSNGTFYFHFANKQEILLEVAWGTTRKMIEEAEAGIRRGTPMPANGPSALTAYFAACANPAEYAGRIFWAERELSELGIEV